MWHVDIDVWPMSTMFGAIIVQSIFLTIGTPELAHEGEVWGVWSD